ncbi:hypothetical protein DUI87_18396 [Hirundo rustica rustica]|uniref:Uncharacterized protein n=1 Tax=Hirundo rustica rustica TaxID=333673 RepID=A0A3M0JVZ1_HIRRU|nr:hypothetical protein DUI87_18396 [Hirundo rustica rustica]
MLLSFDVDVLSDFVFMEHDDIVEELVIQSAVIHKNIKPPPPSPCGPSAQAYSNTSIVIRSLSLNKSQVEHPCVIFLYLVPRAAGKFIPGEAGWGAGGTGILLLLRSPTMLTGSSSGCTRGGNLCHQWVDDDDPGQPIYNSSKVGNDQDKYIGRQSHRNLLEVSFNLVVWHVWNPPGVTVINYSHETPDREGFSTPNVNHEACL